MFISLKMAGKWSLIGPKTPTSHNTTTQSKTAHNHDQEIIPLPIRVCIMPIRVWHAKQPTTHTPAHSGPANPYAYRPSHTRMIRVSSPSYAYHQKHFHVENVISLTHTRMASLHTRITCALRMALRMARTAPSLFSLQAISYAYGLVSYAYDQRHFLQCLPWIPAARIHPIPAKTVQISNSITLMFSNSNSSQFNLTS